jgi:hypothetical protein
MIEVKTAIYTEEEARSATVQAIIDGDNFDFKIALVHTPFASDEQLWKLFKQGSPAILAVMASKESTSKEILAELTRDKDHKFDYRLAGNQALPTSSAEEIWQRNVDIWIDSHDLEELETSLSVLETISRRQAKKISNIVSYRYRELFRIFPTNEIVEIAYNLIRNNLLNEEILIRIAGYGFLSQASFHIRELAFASISAKTIIDNINNWEGLIEYLQIAYAEDSDTLKNLLVKAEVFTEEEFSSLSEEMLYKVMNWTWIV